VKETTGKLENGQLLSGCEFVQNIASPSLSPDRRIKIEQTTNKQQQADARFYHVASVTRYWDVATIGNA